MSVDVDAKAALAMSALVALVEAVVAKQQIRTQPADEIVVIARYARERGLSPKSLTREAKRAGIAHRMGRQLVAKRGALVALLDADPAPATTATPENAYVGMTRAARRRAA